MESEGTQLLNYKSSSVHDLKLIKEIFWQACKIGNIELIKNSVKMWEEQKQREEEE